MARRAGRRRVITVIERESSGNQLLEATVDESEEGVRLDIFLGQKEEVGSRTRAAALIDEGAVSVDGNLRARSHHVSGGETIVVRLPDAEVDLERAPIPEDIPVSVLYEDDSLLVVDKPPGMVVHPSRGHMSGTLVNALMGYGISGGEAFRPGVVHRLDRDTSGLLVVARDPQVRRALADLIRGRQMKRRYLALVTGVLSEATGTVEAPIGRDPVRRKVMVVGGVRPREAVTHFTVLERLKTFTYLEVELETGRTHQIRVHFQAIGHPVAGDQDYARRDRLQVGRQFLHSHRLSFPHPVSGKHVDVISDLPADLERALGAARLLQ